MNNGQAYCSSAHSSTRGTCANPALCRVRVRWKSVLLDQQPSLLTLRQQCPVFVRMDHRYYAAVCLLNDVHADLVVRAFARRPATWLSRKCLRGLPVLVHEVSRRVCGLRLRRTDPELALSFRFMLPSAHLYCFGVRIVSFRSSIAHPTYPLSTLHCVPHGSSARLEAERIATPFSEGSFILYFHAGSSRRTNIAIALTTPG